MKKLISNAAMEMAEAAARKAAAKKYIMAKEIPLMTKSIYKTLTSPKTLNETILKYKPIEPIKKREMQKSTPMTSVSSKNKTKTY